jgi:hypothetical protein
MELTKEFEGLIHLIARAFGRASGSETPEVHADVVLEHAKAIAAEDAQKAEPDEAVPQEQAAQ